MHTERLFGFVSSLLLVSCGNDNSVTKVYNSPPAVSIQLPADGSSSDEGEAVEFQAIVADDGDDPQDLTLLWTSDLDGALSDSSVADADGYVFLTTASLSAGNHVVTLMATDSDAESGEDWVSLAVQAVEGAPTVTIVHPIPGESGVEGEDFEFVAVVDDAQDDPTALILDMSSDIDGVFCSPTPDLVGKATCETSLSAGGHVITYTVTDTDGLSASDAVYFEVASLDETDVDGDGWTPEMGDCDDSDAHVHPGAEESPNGVDDDCDGTIDEGTAAYDDDGDGMTELEGDCDDGDDDVYVGATEVCDGIDNDCDGDVDEGTSCLDDDGDGYTEISGDCDDTSSATYPGATEIPDGEDNDCDGYIDEGTTNYDDDGDCFCEADSCTGSVDPTCTDPEGGDCDDGDEDINPDALEVCDGDDNDCDDVIDEPDASDARTWYIDADDDGYGATSATSTSCDAPAGYVGVAGDCDDDSSAVNPAATEVCNDVDDDCDHSIDEGVKTTYYLDSDSDGYGNPSATKEGCSAPTGYVANDKDCDDTRSSVSPAATESCNGRDDDCDGTTDESDASDASTWYLDSDGDGYGVSTTTKTACTKPTGYSSVSTDCNDGSSSISPAATETCNSVDDDCDGSTDEGVTTTYYQDYDGDGYGNASVTKTACTKPTGYVTNSDDCDDTSSALSPLTVWYIDYDGDGYGSSGTTKTQCTKPTGYVSNSSDCNDLSASASPATTESCDGIDNDCDSSIDEAGASGCTTWYYDYDVDGYGSSSVSGSCLCSKSGYYTSSVNTDCYDYNSSANPADTYYWSINRGDGKYDYNCDGSETKYYNGGYSCGGWPGCSTTSGWSGSTPACGATGTYVYECYLDWFSCSTSSSTYTQYCR